MREDWIEVELGKILLLSKNKHQPKKIENLFYVGLEHIEKGSGKLTKNVGVEPIKTVKNKFEKGQILYGKLRPYLNKAHLSTKPGVCSTDILVLEVSDIISPKYAINYILSRQFVNDMSSNTSGVSLPRVSTKYIKNYSVPLAPLPEQRAIVAKIEQLFSELDNGVANLKAAKDKLAIFREAVLQKAFEGELTKEWRKQQADLPTANELLEQIKKAQIKHNNKQLEKWNRAVDAWEASGKKGKKPTKPRKQKELPKLSQDNLPTLPNSMAWVQLGNIVWSVKDGPHYSPEYTNSGIPFISGGNIRPSGIDFSNTKYISPELHKELSIRCKPELNDILYTKGGTTGIARVNTYDIDFNVWVHVAVLKPIDPIVPFYLQHALNSTHCYKQSQKQTHGVGNQDLGLTRMVLITLPVCSIEEQTQIVQEIETRLSVCDNAIANIEESLTKAEALRQSILKKAFAGKLLTNAELQACRQEPDWEPAAKLLERIKNNKKSTPRKKSTT
ncbi:MAG: restriction endonuclease subunit S [Candidatus Electrothrix communis]|nr:MAG: restriction endonuclease subunit S [Candidatus Electrothrix communis]